MLPQSRSNVSSVLEPSCAGKTVAQLVAQLVPTSTDKAPSYQEILRRLNLMAVGCDFLLGHPDLKPSDRDLGFFISGSSVQNACAASSAARMSPDQQKADKKSTVPIPEYQAPKPTCETQPWRERAQTLTPQEREQMWHILVRVSSCFPHFGPPSRTTARHLLAAAKLSREALGFDGGDVTPGAASRWANLQLEHSRSAYGRA
jgi:hypothetical protein